mmetsp:Transcript_76229/g.143649  ORF Transcript_76229/g.143649 Transcript_76229/m.143649 type:complete len:179 (-) Transcript_76229:257-793(-)
MRTHENTVDEQRMHAFCNRWEVTLPKPRVFGQGAKEQGEKIGVKDQEHQAKDDRSRGYNKALEEDEHLWNAPLHTKHPIKDLEEPQDRNIEVQDHGQTKHQIQKKPYILATVLLTLESHEAYEDFKAENHREEDIHNHEHWSAILETVRIIVIHIDCCPDYVKYANSKEEILEVTASG